MEALLNIVPELLILATIRILFLAIFQKLEKERMMCVLV